MGGVPSKEKNQDEKLALQAQIGTIELNTYHSIDKSSSYSQVRPRQLSQLLLKQEV